MACDVMSCQFTSGRAVDLFMFSSYLFCIFSGLLALFLIIFGQA